MRNNFDVLSVEIYGASHAECIGIKVCGLPKGKKIDVNELQAFMDRRRAQKSAYSTARIEEDKVEFLSGIKDGVLTGEMLEGVVYNKSQHSKDYSKLANTPRPSHADYVAKVKYNGEMDMRGGGCFSGRMTLALCILGGIAKQLLREYGIEVEAYISSIGKVNISSYKNEIPSVDSIKNANPIFRVLDDTKLDAVNKEIQDAHNDGDSIGGSVECIVYNPPVGLGSPILDSLEGKLSSAMFAIPALKGIEFGAGFDICAMNGSKANDNFYYDEDGKVKTYTNNNGGINGGITNGMPITMRCAFKPTPSIYKKQMTIDMETKQNVEIQIEGRHDSCIVPRAVVCVEAVTALTILDEVLLNK